MIKRLGFAQICMMMGLSMCLAQTNIITSFPLLSQHSSLEDYENDCGEWAVASILSYWNIHGYQYYTAFDRFLGTGINPNVTANRELLAELAIKLQDPLGYMSSGGTGSYGTNPLSMEQGIRSFCNDGEYENDYNFLVDAYSGSASINYADVWEKVVTEIDNGRPVLFLVAGTITVKSDYTDWYSAYLWHYMPVYGYDEDMDGRKTLIAASLGTWGRKIYLDLESVNNTISMFPDIWTITPQKLNSELPVTKISVGLSTEDVVLYSSVRSASVVDHVEYEVNLYGEQWETVGQVTDPAFAYEAVYSTAGITYAEKVRFRSRAQDYHGNYSEWSYSGSYYTVSNSVPAVNDKDVPTAVSDILSDDAVYIYPNPTSDILNIVADAEVNSAITVAIYDVYGRMVYTTLFEDGNADEGLLSMDLSFLPRGTYLLLIRYADQNIMRRVVKI